MHYAILALPAERSIVTIHDLVFLHTYKGLTRKFLKWIFLDLPINKARIVSTISEKSKQEILLHCTCTANKIYLIPNPVDPMLEARSTNGISSVSNPLLMSENINSKSNPGDNTIGFKSICHPSIDGATEQTPFRILFLGTKPNKNLELSIEALYTLNIHLRIIGILTAHQHSLLKKFNIDYSAAHHLSDAELINEYHQADIILFPSTYEGFGLPLLEGFQSGKPVITSNIPPMSDIAGDAAMLVDPYDTSDIRDAVQRLIADPVLRTNLVERGFAIAEAHHPKRIAVAYHDLWIKRWNEYHILKNALP